MNYKKIVVAGGGILGSQIAFQSAYCGYQVVILIREEDPRDVTVKKLEDLKKTYIDTIEVMDTKEGKVDGVWARGIADIDNFKKKECLDKVNKALDLITIETDQAKALAKADLVIESITENFDIKSAFYRGIAPLLDEDTVVVTNSSTLLPSKLAKYTERPSKYLALHFANSIWKNNIAEVMRHSGTANKYFNEIIAFAESIRMIPLAAKEEKSGYLLNSMLVPFLLCAMDKAWTLGTGAPKGPFQIMDVVGLETARNIVMQYQKVPNIFDPILKKMMMPYNYDGMLEILDKYIEEGKMGKAAGEGFYKYK